MPRRSNPALVTARALVRVVLVAVVGCSSAREAYRARPVVLVSRHAEVDTFLERARALVTAGDLANASASLALLLHAYPDDPVAPLARALAVRVSLARGDLANARALLVPIAPAADPAVVRSSMLARAALDANDLEFPRAFETARTLVGRLPDRADNAELGCVLAVAATRTSHTALALRAIVDVEAARADTVPFLVTLPVCATDEGRATLLADALARTDDPDLLATTINALPAGAAMRRPLAMRLRDVAAARHELAQWLQWLVDLPDEVAVSDVDPQRVPVLRVTLGLLAPLHGGRTSVGAAMLRGVQYALEGVGDVVIAPEDEGETPDEVSAAIDRLVARNVRAIVGVSRADLSGAAAIRAQAARVHLYLLSATEGIEETGDRVHLAGPTQEARELLVRRTVLGRARHVVVVADPSLGESGTALQRELEAAGVVASAGRADAFGRLASVHDASETYVFVGASGREARLTYALPLHHDPSRWLLDARGAPPGSGGTYLGLARSDALDALVAMHCERTGEAPDEFVLLAHDAARTALSTVRVGDATVSSGRALAQPFRLVTGTIDAQGAVLAGTAPAAAARCPRE